MTTLGKIDFVFFFLKKKIHVGGSFGYYNIWNYVNKTPHTGINTQTLLKEILKRLIEDGFIIEVIKTDTQPVYNLTFKGVLFQGYKKKAFNKKVKKILYFVSLIAVIIAGIYYTIEIYKDLLLLFY